MIRDVIAAEWLKLRTARSTAVVLGAALAVMALFLLITWQGVGIWDRSSPEQRARFGMAEPAWLAGWAAGLCLAVLGVLAITSEYRSGMIRTTLTVAPGRSAVLAAKAAVVGGLALGAGLFVVLGTFAATRLIVGDRAIAGFQSPIAGHLPEILVRGCLVAVYALLALGLAALLRSAAAAIVTIVLLWYILPIGGNLLPGPWGERFTSFTLDALPEQVIGQDNENSVFGAVLPPAAAVAVMVAYAALPLAAAMLALRRRDA
ncbi:ABC transporter permease [Actinomadura sp. 9N407]|uniref:ABC transporter permease n=1 Tax=Actinomadura sp. 9N407 TaxID=3375154 RepID=UPI0037A66A6A